MGPMVIGVVTSPCSLHLRVILTPTYRWLYDHHLGDIVSECDVPTALSQTKIIPSPSIRMPLSRVLADIWKQGVQIEVS